MLAGGRTQRYLDVVEEAHAKDVPQSLATILCVVALSFLQQQARAPKRVGIVPAALQCTLCPIALQAGMRLASEGMLIARLESNLLWSSPHPTAEAPGTRYTAIHLRACLIKQKVKQSITLPSYELLIDAAFQSAGQCRHVGLNQALMCTDGHIIKNRH